MLVLTIVLMMAALAAWAAWFSLRKVRRIGAARYFGAVGRLGLDLTRIGAGLIASAVAIFLRPSGEIEDDHSTFEEDYEKTVHAISDDYGPVVPRRDGYL